MIIEDGTGTGRKAQVNSGNRLYVRSVSNTEGQEANTDGDAYNINTGYVTLTNAVDTPVLYVKNNEIKSLYIEAIAFGVQPSTGGVSTEKTYATVIRNPTAGTIVSDATDVPIKSNRNYGNQNVFDADVFKGGTGSTLTDGEDHLILQLSEGSRAFATINEVIPKGASIAIKIKPPTSNTSMDVYTALVCYLKEPNN
jgi:hypothetical protein